MKKDEMTRKFQDIFRDKRNSTEPVNVKLENTKKWREKYTEKIQHNTRKQWKRVQMEKKKIQRKFTSKYERREW